jgi:O-antigen ligase
VKSVQFPDDASRQDSGLFWLCALLLIVAMVAGGGQGGRGDMFAQLLAVIVLAYAWRLKNQRGKLIHHGPAWALWLVPVLLALPVLQLLPIPFSLWNSGAARHEIASQLAAVGLSPSPHVALAPLAAERALWSLFPAVAMFVSALALSRHRQRLLLGLVLVLAIMNVVLGMAQLAQGPESALRFYANTNPTEAVGFFANRNHLASLLVMALPLTLAASAWIANEYAHGAPISPLWIAVGILSAVLLILGVALARSRAGLMLGMLAVLLSLPGILSLRKRRGAKRVLSLIMGLGLMLSVQFALFGILQRLDTDTIEDGRWHYARITADAAAAHAPLGTGLGGFRLAFQPFEVRTGQGPTIINHAHDDYLELWLEGGWLALPPIILLLTALVAIGLRAWFGRYDGNAQDRLIARTVWLSLLIAALHSLVDYPLRTSADSSVVALLFAVALSHAWPRTPAPSVPAMTADESETSSHPVAGSNIRFLKR